MQIFLNFILFFFVTNITCLKILRFNLKIQRNLQSRYYILRDFVITFYYQIIFIRLFFFFYNFTLLGDIFISLLNF